MLSHSRQGSDIISACIVSLHLLALVKIVAKSRGYLKIINNILELPFFPPVLCGECDESIFTVDLRLKLWKVSSCFHLGSSVLAQIISSCDL